MTVTYSLNVANAKLTGFSKLLLRWKGSIYKLLYREMGIYVMLYYALSLMYRYLLTRQQREVFEKVALYCESFTNMVPLTFVLGFYVSIVVTRWWQQFLQIPWPDKVVMLVAANVQGTDERGRVIRRTLARYLLLLMTLTFQSVSTSVRRRFPTLDHIEAAGLMTKEERIIFDKVPATHGKYWTAAVWFTNLAIRAHKEGRIKDIMLKQLLDELHVFRGCCGMMFAYDWISIPLVYTQTVTIATYTYFLATVMGRQYLDPNKGYNNHDVDLYIPVFTVFEFFFFMGWLKVAEQLINPFGEDDDDFELNWCLDRNLLVCFTIVDDMYGKHPRLVKDIYWDQNEPALPYTRSSVGFRTQAHLGSALDLNIDLNEAEFVPLETILEDDNDDKNYDGSPPASPVDLISMDNPASNQDNSSQAGLRLAIDSIKGSLLSGRFMNLIKGPSTDNINRLPNRTPSVKSSQNQPLLSSFALKTPPSKSRTRTTSATERTAGGPPASSNPLEVIGNRRSYQQHSRNNLNISYDDIPSAPVVLGSGRPSTRAGTPVDKRSFRSVRLNSRDQESIVAPQNSYPGADGFRFPSPFMVTPVTDQQPLVGLVDQSIEIESDEEVDIKTPTIQTPAQSQSGSTNASRVDLENIGNTVFDGEMQNKKETTPVDPDPVTPVIDPFEPGSTSEEPLASFYDDTNQNTVRSISELIKSEKDQKAKDT